MGVLVRIFPHFPSFYPTLLPESEILRVRVPICLHGISDCTIQLSVNPMHCGVGNVQAVTLLQYLCTDFQSMHVAIIWMASNVVSPTATWIGME